MDVVHSLNTGICSAEAVNTGVHLGGFIGQTMNKGVINMTDCLSAGKIEVAYRVCVGSVFGRATNEERTVNLSNVYATKESHNVTFFGMGEGGSTTAAINGGVIADLTNIIYPLMSQRRNYFLYFKHFSTNHKL